ncbi:hypothetical protein ElyMa_002217600 [Elysia marginata]|uniref:Uncharacterized protein n=1 Tax=Elysia marginata TaxID=1093978 RepID=A0AAV4FV69_9GAST|nr:hypothetical protein ElyMa_002217600 [Elysia marginata]
MNNNNKKIKLFNFRRSGSSQHQLRSSFLFLRRNPVHSTRFGPDIDSNIISNGDKTALEKINPGARRFDSYGRHKYWGAAWLARLRCPAKWISPGVVKAPWLGEEGLWAGR